MLERLVRMRFIKASVVVAFLALTSAGSLAPVARAQTEQAPVVTVPAAGTTVRGRLSSAGRPLARTTVAFYGSDRALALSVESDASGNYQTASLAPGTYTARVIVGGKLLPIVSGTFTVSAPSPNATPLVLPEWHPGPVPFRQPLPPPPSAPPPPPPTPIPESATTPPPRTSPTPTPTPAVRTFYVTDRAASDSPSGSPFDASPQSECADLPGCPLRYGAVETASDATTPLLANEFVTRLAAAYGRGAKRDVVVYIHGCCTDFPTALTEESLIAAEITSAPVIVYSIPAKNNLTIVPGLVLPLNYFYDENEYTWSFPHLTALLDELIAIRPGLRINIMAHSLGNRVFVSAAQLFAYEHRNDRITPFDNVILMAPDVDTQTFLEAVPLLSHFGAHVTVYRSDNDEAIFGSEKIHEHPRLGRVDKSQYFSGIAPTVDAIDATTFKCEATGHFYWKLSSFVRSDIAAALADDRPVSPRRSGELVSTGPSSWQFVVKGAAPAGDCTPIPLSLDG